MSCGCGGNAGRALARVRENFINRQGTWVTLPGGIRKKALIKHSVNEMLRTTQSDDAQEKKATVFTFGASAWGLVIEGMILTVGGAVEVKGEDGRPLMSEGHPVTIDMSRPYKVATPLHPDWRQGVVTQLVVAAFPDV